MGPEERSRYGICMDLRTQTWNSPHLCTSTPLPVAFKISRDHLTKTKRTRAGSEIPSCKLKTPVQHQKQKIKNKPAAAGNRDLFHSDWHWPIGACFCRTSCYDGTGLCVFLFFHLCEGAGAKNIKVMKSWNCAPGSMNQDNKKKENLIIVDFAHLPVKGLACPLSLVTPLQPGVLKHSSIEFEISTIIIKQQ